MGDDLDGGADVADMANLNKSGDSIEDFGDFGGG